MIAACELAMSDGAHVPFNAGLLATIRAAFPEEEVLFLGARTHLHGVQKQLGDPLAASVTWLEIEPSGPSLTYWPRLFCDFRIIWKLWGLVRRSQPEGLLILTSSYPSTLLAAKLVERLRSKGIGLQAVLHGGFSGVTTRRYRHPIRRFEEMRTALTLFKHSDMQYLVLEHSIRTELLACLPSLAGRVEVLEHPLAPNEDAFRGDALDLPIRFGFLGLANEAKGFPTFARLAAAIARNYHDRAEFHAIGRFPAPDASVVPEMHGLATRPGTERLSRETFIGGVRPLHFVVLPHHAKDYDMSGTGTLLDAIATRKPLIARRIAIFESLFDRYGDIGYLFRDEAELKEIVQEIVERADRRRYGAQVSNLEMARSARMPMSLAIAYREICDRSNRSSRTPGHVTAQTLKPVARR